MGVTGGGFDPGGGGPADDSAGVTFEEVPEDEKDQSAAPGSPRAWANQVFSTQAFSEWRNIWPTILNIAGRDKRPVDPVELASILLTRFGNSLPAQGIELRKIIRQHSNLLFDRLRKYGGNLNEFYRNEISTSGSIGPGLKPSDIVGRYLPDRPQRPPRPETKGQKEKRLQQEEEERRTRERLREDHDNPVIAVINGQEIRSSEWTRLRGQYDSLTRWYQGREVENEEIERWIKSGKSNYQITIELSRDDRFFRSPSWKSDSIKYKGAHRDLIGPNVKFDKDLIRKAIVRNWSTSDYAEQLRQRPEYLKSNEFQSTSTKFQNLYSKIFGGPITSGVKNAVQEAAIARWSEDQFAAWLRGQPEYATSVEFQAKRRNMRIGLAEAFGVSLSRFSTPLNTSVIPPAAFELPDSPRIEGEPGLGRRTPRRTVPDETGFVPHPVRTTPVPGPPPRR